MPHQHLLVWCKLVLYLRIVRALLPRGDGDAYRHGGGGGWHELGLMVVALATTRRRMTSCPECIIIYQEETSGDIITHLLGLTGVF